MECKSQKVSTHTYQRKTSYYVQRSSSSSSLALRFDPAAKCLKVSMRSGVCGHQCRYSKTCLRISGKTKTQTPGGRTSFYRDSVDLPTGGQPCRTSQDTCFVFLQRSRDSFLTSQKHRAQHRSLTVPLNTTRSLSWYCHPV